MRSALGVAGLELLESDGGDAPLGKAPQRAGAHDPEADDRDLPLHFAPRVAGGSSL
jgi:hypothetical protein